MRSVSRYVSGDREAPRARWARAATVAAAALVSIGTGQVSRAAVSPNWSASPNWSGYAATNPDGATVSFSTVTGTWKVPVATCRSKDAGAASTVWVGLGGYTGGSRTEQTGTDSSCDAKRKPRYWAWFELAPYPANSIPNLVEPGDRITGTVTILKQGFGVVQMQVQNRTRGWTVTRKLSSSQPDTSSAEWIVSSVATCARFGECAQASLANFGRAGMTEISAVGNSRRGNLASAAWKIIPLHLVPGTLTVPTLNPDGAATRSRAVSPAGASPGPVAKGGGAFKVKWVAVATRGV